MDFFLDDNNVYERLKEQYLQHGKLIIAYDFDETVYNTYKDPNKSFDMVVDLIKRWRKYATLILFTARYTKEDNYCSEEFGDYEFVIDYLNKNNIPYDYVNSDANGLVPIGRKIYYNIFLDDKAGLSSAYSVLIKLIEKIESGEI